MNWRTQGIIYVIKAMGQPNYKIGWTGQNPVHRMKALQTGSIWDLRLVATTPGTIRHEKGCHLWLFDAAASVGVEVRHLNREWFQCDAGVDVFMEVVEKSMSMFSSANQKRACSMTPAADFLRASISTCSSKDRDWLNAELNKYTPLPPIEQWSRTL